MKAPTVLLESFKPAEIVTLIDNTQAYFRQRPLSASTVNRYKHDMLSGNWFVETGDTVKLAKINGKEIIVDGQHRLNAAMFAPKGKPIFFWVFRYVPLEAFAFLDQGNPRTLKDVFDIHNHGWEAAPAVFASTATMLWKCEKTGSPAIRPESVDFEAAGNVAHWTIATYPELPEYYKLISEELKDIQAGGLGGKAWILYLAFRWSVLDSKMCTEVLNHFACRGKFAAAVQRMQRATDKGGDSPKSAQEISELQSDDAYAAPNPIWDECRKQVASFREGMKDPETGKIFKTRNKDLSDFTMFAYQTAWNAVRAGESKQSYVNGLKSAIASSSYDHIPQSI